MRLLFFVISEAHLHVHLLSSSPPLPPLHRLGVGLSPTRIVCASFLSVRCWVSPTHHHHHYHHHHSDKYNECSARIETVSRTHGIIHPHLNIARLEAASIVKI